jgi:hypothetical protein
MRDVLKRDVPKEPTGHDRAVLLEQEHVSARDTDCFSVLLKWEGDAPYNISD